MKKYWYLAYCHPKRRRTGQITSGKIQGIDSYYPLVLTAKFYAANDRKNRAYVPALSVYSMWILTSFHR